jgi:hypothetical protein
MSATESTRPATAQAAAHVVVLGNEKGGSGKSTLAMHVAAALMDVGQRVATIDLDSRQKSFTRYVEFRRDWAKRTPLNDSFVDFDVLGELDPVNFAVTGEGPYAQMVRDARRRRREIDGMRMDWVVVRNRISPAGSGPGGLVGEGLEQLAARLGFRCVEGFAERLIYRELFPRGLTALDAVEEGVPGTAPDPAQASVRLEVLRLVEGLKLPLNENGRRRAAARREWFAAQGSPLDVHDFIGA